MSFSVPEDCIKIRMSEDGRQLLAFMPNGEKLPAIKSIDIHSECGSLVWGTIKVLVDVSGIDFDKIHSDVVVEAKLDNKKLLGVVNKDKSVVQSDQ
jgi:hypothetical protein